MTRAVVVYESLWGDTASVARAIAEGIAAQTGASARALSAVFDTRIRGPFGSAAPAIGKALEHAGYRSIAKPVGFIVAGKYGPLREGELERGREWGADLGRSMQ